MQTHVHYKLNTHIYSYMHTCTHTDIRECTHTHVHTYMYTHKHTVPSGHILTKLELQVLSSLLATYSDEKLKEIKLSIQEKEKIKDISREEVEKTLRQSGLTSVAVGLKDNIDKGISH